MMPIFNFQQTVFGHISFGVLTMIIFVIYSGKAAHISRDDLRNA